MLKGLTQTVCQSIGCKIVGELTAELSVRLHEAGGCGIEVGWSGRIGCSIPESTWRLGLANTFDGFLNNVFSMALKRAPG